jgi:hypothetical protein
MLICSIALTFVEHPQLDFDGVKSITSGCNCCIRIGGQGAFFANRAPVIDRFRNCVLSLLNFGLQQPDTSLNVGHPFLLCELILPNTAYFLRLNANIVVCCLIKTKAFPAIFELLSKVVDG